jgi:hypothetical protein
MKGSHSTQFARSVIALVIIAVLLVVWGGYVYRVEAGDQITNKNEIWIAKQSENSGSYNAQIPDSTSKNFAGITVPIDTAGTTLIIEQGPLSKNSSQNYQP